MIVLAGLLGARTARAQPSAPAPGIPRYAAPSSGLEWRAAAHPLRLFDVTGHRAAVFGRQTGLLEAWIYPIKLLHGFRLEFRQEGSPEPVRGESVLEQIIARPESTTLVYVHPSFTVRETIWVPLDEPAIVISFEVDSDRPLRITAKFVPDFKPMWPASLGGQHSYWIDDEKAFALTDGTGSPTALVGSPAVAAFTDFTDHQFIGGEMLLQLRILPEQARAMFFPLVMALSLESEQKAREVFRRVLARVREHYDARVAYHREFLARTLEIETPDAELNRALTWAKLALDAGWVCHPKHGCGLVAGYGPSGDGERPGFAWWFGGDALLATWALEDYGDLPGALQALRFLKARQRADGKMLHEMTQSVDLIDWFGKYGFAYYHADTTPMYLYSIAEYWRRTGDHKFLEEFWESAKTAYAYCVSTVDPADGLMDNTKAGLAAIEVGPLRGKVVKDIYLEGFWLAALEAMRSMALAMDDNKLAGDARVLASKARLSLGESWWNPEGKHFAFGVDANGKRADMHGSWPAVLVGLNLLKLSKAPGEPASIPDLNFRTQLLLQAEKFAIPELSTDWGIRWLSNKDPLYDPLSYNNGTVWPFISGFAAWAQYNAGQALAGYSTLVSLARLTGAQSPGALPELMNGDRFRPGEHSVPHQLFSSWSVVVPTVRGLLGLRTVVADQGSGERSLKFAPQLPAHWSFVRFSNYIAGSTRVSGEIRQQTNRMSFMLDFDGVPPPVEFIASLPMGARIERVLVNGKAVKVPQFWGAQFSWGVQVHVDVPPAKHTEVAVEHEGAVGIIPAEPRPDPGGRTTSLKILDVNYWYPERGQKTGEAQLMLAGLGGRTYTLDLATTVSPLSAEGATVYKTENGYRLEVWFEGSDYVTRKIRLRF